MQDSASNGSISTEPTQEHIGYEIACGCAGNDTPDERKLYVRIFTFAILVVGILTFGIYALVGMFN